MGLTLGTMHAPLKRLPSIALPRAEATGNPENPEELTLASTELRTALGNDRPVLEGVYNEARLLATLRPVL
jgi:hypothetical protein